MFSTTTKAKDTILEGELTQVETTPFRGCSAVLVGGSAPAFKYGPLGGKKKAMLAYGVIQISATVVSAISLAAIALGLCAVKQESKAFNGCVQEVIAEGKTNAQAVRFCNGGKLRI